jgi:tetratricopeptide (TPR) repeat protein
VIASAVAQPGRHPWIDQFLSDPRRGYADLVAGHTAIHPYQRADAPDAARLLFGGLAEDDPARAVLDNAVLDWLDTRRRESAPPRPGPRQSWVREISETLEIVYILGLPRSAVALRRRRAEWTDFCARHVLAPSRDARAMLWRTLALTQNLAHTTDPALSAQELVPLWHLLCREAGGALPTRYLAIGLLGLRRLPQANSDLPWLAGLAHWALARKPNGAAFRAEWLALKSLYPRNPSSWRTQVTQLLDTSLFSDAGITAPGWWGEADPDLRLRPRGPNQSSPEVLRSPGPEACIAVIGRLGEPFASMRANIDALVAGHRRFLSATGQPSYFSRMVHALGSALMDQPADSPAERARLAEALAREALAWEPNNGFLWSVWHRALIAQGRLQAAELLGWEQLRRIPDQPDGFTQLALLLARLPQRQLEAAALLRETIERFPANVPARTQLAELLIAGDRAEEAMAVMYDAFADGAANEFSFAVRTRLLAHAGRTDDANATVAEGLRRFPQDRFLADLASRLARGQPLPWVAKELAAPLPAASETEPDGDAELARMLALGRLRRLRFLQEHAATLGEPPVAGSDLLQGDVETAYASVLSLRAGGTEVDVMPVFAVAFEAALNAEDRARLEKLAQTQPRLRALVLVARALVGDVTAASEIDAWLAEPLPPGKERIEGRLHAALRIVRGDAASILEPLQLHRAAVLRLVHDASEATLGEALLAA